MQSYMPSGSVSGLDDPFASTGRDYYFTATAALVGPVRGMMYVSRKPT